MLHELWTQILSSSWLEIIAVIFGILSVWYAHKENILIFPFGIISTTIYIYVFFQAQIYAQSGINLYYTIVSIYGWYAWTHKDQHNETLKINRLNTRMQILFIAVTVLLFLFLVWFIGIFTKTDFEYMKSGVLYFDAAVSAMCLVAMFLSARKKVENWIYWIIADVVCIPLCIKQGLYFTVLQFAVFLVIATMGLIKWNKKYKERIKEESNYLQNK